ncbi:uncharacterized protein METZ01_LOCUS180515 [marine metagenome]|uniref:General secretion pathway GspH domain-containing protein n=1 Tax=marine metagenome TaxID=408172 RepID=A0A382CPW0_9ZZZZ
MLLGSIRQIRFSKIILSYKKNADHYQRFFLYRTTGFTLVELIAVMVLVSIIGSAVVTSYSSYNRWLDKNEAILGMVRTIRKARDHCLTRNEKFFLTVDAVRNTYSLQYKDSRDKLFLPQKASAQFTMPFYTDITSLTMGAGHVSMPNATIEFNILGEPVIDYDLNIYFNDGERVIVVVTPTGYIHVQ